MQISNQILRGGPAASTQQQLKQKWKLLTQKLSEGIINYRFLSEIQRSRISADTRPLSVCFIRRESTCPWASWFHAWAIIAHVAPGLSACKCPQGERHINRWRSRNHRVSFSRKPFWRFFKKVMK